MRQLVKSDTPTPPMTAAKANWGAGVAGVLMLGIQTWAAWRAGDVTTVLANLDQVITQTLGVAGAVYLVVRQKRNTLLVKR